MFTGFMPGIHANTIAFMALLLPIDKSTGLAMFIVSMGISHSFFDSLPSILLGAPSEESSVNLLPGHEMLLKGKGLEAVELMAFGGLAAAAFGIALAPLFFSFAKNYSAHFPAVIPALVAGTIALMIIGEKNKASAALVSLAAGLLGIFLLNSGVREPVFVLITGFFGIPGLLQSLSANAKIPEQEMWVHAKAGTGIGFVAAVTSGFLAAFPGIGPSQAATIVKTFYRKITKQEYLILSGGINTGNLFFSIIMLHALGKTRTGMAAALEGAMKMDYMALITLYITAAMSAGICAALIGAVAQYAIVWIKKIDYRKISAVTMIFMAILVLYFSGIAGILACTAAAGVSLFALGSNVRRSHCMAFLLFPTLSFYLGLG